MFRGSDLAMLIWRAGGLKSGADISKTDLEQLLMNDSIYHIPGGNGLSENGIDIKKSADLAIVSGFRDAAKDVALAFNRPGIEQMNILYVGFPAVYMLISYYPQFGKVCLIFFSLTHKNVFRHYMNKLAVYTRPTFLSYIYLTDPY